MCSRGRFEQGEQVFDEAGRLFFVAFEIEFVVIGGVEPCFVPGPGCHCASVCVKLNIPGIRSEEKLTDPPRRLMDKNPFGEFTGNLIFVD